MEEILDVEKKPLRIGQKVVCTTPKSSGVLTGVIIKMKKNLLTIQMPWGNWNKYSYNVFGV